MYHYIIKLSFKSNNGCLYGYYQQSTKFAQAFFICLYICEQNLKYN